MRLCTILSGFGLLLAVNGQTCIPRETEWNYDVYESVAGRIDCHGGNDGQTIKKFGEIFLCAGFAEDMDIELALNLTLANALYPYCSSYCMYNYFNMTNTIENPGGYGSYNGPQEYFQWNNGGQCWDFNVRGATTCYPNQNERDIVVNNYNKIEDCPTSAPSYSPSFDPTPVPTTSPTNDPTWSQAPTESPTESPTTSPTEFPTPSPTAMPSPGPTNSPTELPTPGPTESPTPIPTQTPTACYDRTPWQQCRTWKSDCWSTDPDIREQMHKECPLTCGTCDGASQAPSLAPTMDPTGSPTLEPTGSPTGCEDDVSCIGVTMEICYASQLAQDRCPKTCGLCHGATLTPTAMPVTTTISPTRTPSELIIELTGDGDEFPIWAIAVIAGLFGCIVILLIARFMFPQNQILKVLTPRWKEPPTWWKKAVEDEKNKTAGGPSNPDDVIGEMPDDFEDDDYETGTGRTMGSEGRIARNTDRNYTTDGGRAVATNRSYGLDNIESPPQSPQQPGQGGPQGKGDKDKASLWIVNRTNSGRIAIQAVAKDAKKGEAKDGGDDAPPPGDAEVDVVKSGGVEMTDMNAGPDSPSVRESNPVPPYHSESNMMPDASAPGVDQGFSSSPELAPAQAPNVS